MPPQEQNKTSWLITGAAAKAEMRSHQARREKTREGDEERREGRGEESYLADFLDRDLAQNRASDLIEHDDGDDGRGARGAPDGKHEVDLPCQTQRHSCLRDERQPHILCVFLQINKKQK